MSDVSRFYEGILSPGGGLFTGAPSSTQYFPREGGQVYGYNAITGNYEIKRPGEAYASTPAPRAFPPSAAQQHQTAVAAIEQAAPREQQPPQAMALQALPAAPQLGTQPAPAQAPLPPARTSLAALMNTGPSQGFDLGSILAGLVSNSGTLTPGNTGPMNSITQASPWWQQIRGERDAEHSGGFDGFGGGGSLV